MVSNNIRKYYEIDIFKKRWIDPAPFFPLPEWDEISKERSVDTPCKCLNMNHGREHRNVERKEIEN